MPCYVGLDISKRLTSVCVLDSKGAIVKEGVVETNPKAIANFLRGTRIRYTRVGLESGAMASWLYEGLAHAGLPAVCIETRHAHGVLQAQANKTDRDDARGIAELMRTKAFRAVHVKTRESQSLRALLSARRILVAQVKATQNGIRSLLLNWGHKLDAGRRLTFDARVQLFIRKDQTVRGVIEPLLRAQSALRAEIAKLDSQLQAAAASDPVCRLLMTAPGVGRLTALVFRTSVDIPERFTRSRSVGPHFGLVPRTFQSGEVEWRGRISHRGDAEARTHLYLAAAVLLRNGSRSNWLKTWGQAIAERRGRRKAIVAVARRLAAVLHRMWISNSPFRPEVVV